jgi:hypothetical protein
MMRPGTEPQHPGVFMAGCVGTVGGLEKPLAEG